MSGYKPIYKDTFFTSASGLSYIISEGQNIVFSGRAVKSPSKPEVKIKINDKANNYLHPHLENSGWVETDGVYVVEEAYKMFNLEDIYDTGVTDSFGFLCAYKGDWNGATEILSKPVTNRIDPRMKIFWGRWNPTTNNVDIEYGYLHFESELDGDLDFDFSADTHYIEIEASGVYTAYTPDSWITLSTSGDGYDVSVDTNTGEPRTGSVCVKWINGDFEEESKCYEVSQDREHFEFEYSGDTDFIYSGESKTISFTANTEIEVASVPYWITATTINGTTAGTITMSSTMNTGAARTGSVVVRRKNYVYGETASIPVSQSVYELVAEVETVIAPAIGGTISIPFTANTAIRVDSYPSWVNSVVVNGTTAGTITFDVSNNLSESARTDTFTIHSDESIYGGTLSFTLSQEGDLPHSEYLTFEIVSAGTVVFASVIEGETAVTVDYKVNDGPWLSSTSTGVTLNVSEGDVIKWRGMNSSYGSIGQGYGSSFERTTAYFNLSGNIMSLINAGAFENLKTLSQIRTFQSMFYMTKVISAAELILPATSLTESCYASMFSFCQELTSVPFLPATTMAQGCYANMFSWCTKLTDAPALPATELATKCYREMFAYCTSLVNVPDLPATTLAAECYYCMFNSCTSLVNAPVISATTLANTCCYQMFRNTSLVNAPVLPATSLTKSCYYQMFESCASLVNPPALPATIIAENCYRWMFRYCTSLVNAPDLLAKDLDSYGCYYGMFQSCTNLNSVRCLAETFTGSVCVTAWLKGVSPTGTFVKKAGVSWTTGIDGIPSGWTVIEEP